MTVRDGIVTIFVSDLTRSTRFYSDLLGLRVTKTIGDIWVELSAPSGFRIGLHVVGPESPDAGIRGSISLGLETNGDMEADLALLLTHGTVVESPVKNGDAARIVHFADPDGNQLYMYQYNSPASST